MADDFSQFEDVGVILFAGASSDGIIYGVTLGQMYMTLWNYNDLQRKWKRIVGREYASFPPAYIYHYSAKSAIYKEEFGLVYAFVQTTISQTYLFRFVTTPVPKLDAILLLANIEEKIYFCRNAGPWLVYVGDILFLIGRIQGDGTIRIYQVVINDDGNTFTLVQVWRSNAFNRGIFLNGAVAVGNRLVVMTSDHVVCFTPETMASTPEWSEPTVTRYPPGQIETLASTGNVMVCSSTYKPDTIWILPTRRSKIMETVVLPDGSLVAHREIKYDSEPCFWCKYTKPLTAAASATHLFWHTRSCCYKTESKLLDVPALQQICFAKLCSTQEEFKECKTEEDAMKLGIPILAWRRFCR